MPVNEISVQELKQWKDSGKDFQLVDVREPRENEYVNIGGDLIPLADVPTKANEFKKEGDVVVYCRSGMRSADAIIFLQKLGYNNLYNLKGGILAYAQEIDPTLHQY